MQQVIFKTVIGDTNCVLPLPRLDLDLENSIARVFYSVREAVGGMGRTMYTKTLFYDNGNFDTWYANYNSNTYLIDEFFNSLTDDEKVFIIRDNS